MSSWSPERRTAQAGRMRALNADPATAGRRAAALRRVFAEPERRTAQAERARAAWAADPERRGAAAALARGQWADPAQRARMTENTGRAVAAAYSDPALRARVAEARRNAPVLGECAYCGGPAQTRDHVVPRSRGGSDDPANLVPACYSCNASKGARTPEEWFDAAH